MAGIDILEKRGIEYLTARNITSGMGYTVGTLYHQFGSMDGYLLALNGETLDQLADALEKRLENSVREPVLALALGYWEFARRHTALWQVLFQRREKTRDRLPGWYRDKIRRLLALIEAVLTQNRADIRQPRRVAVALWAGVHGVCVLSLTGKLEIVAADAPERLIDILVTAISARDE